MNCNKPALALLTFSPTEATAWLYDLDQPDPTGGIMLCRKHANATVVPMSWQLIDARDPAWPGPADMAPAVETMAAASAHEVIDVTAAPAGAAPAPATAAASSLPSDSAAIDREFAALSADLPITPRRYAEPQVATARAAGVMIESDVRVEGDHDPSLFELPLSDEPAVTPHPGFSA